MTEEGPFGETVFAAEGFQVDIFLAVELEIGGDALNARFHEAVARNLNFRGGKTGVLHKAETRANPAGRRLRIRGNAPSAVSRVPAFRIFSG